MGCTSSKTGSSGRVSLQENTNKIPPQARDFFPPPQDIRPPASSSPAAGQTENKQESSFLSVEPSSPIQNKSKRKKGEYKPPPQPSVEFLPPKPNPYLHPDSNAETGESSSSSNKQAPPSAGSPFKSPTKKKSSYVPPAPISEQFYPEPPASSSPPLPVAAPDSPPKRKSKTRNSSIPGSPKRSSPHKKSPRSSNRSNKSSSNNSSLLAESIDLAPPDLSSPASATSTSPTASAAGKAKDTADDEKSLSESSITAADALSATEASRSRDILENVEVSDLVAGQESKVLQLIGKAPTHNNFDPSLLDILEGQNGSPAIDTDQNSEEGSIPAFSVASINVPGARSKITMDMLHDTPEPNSESGMRFDELYRLKGVLGTGAFSTVREGYHRSNAEISYAVKCINRKKLSEEDEAALLDEVGILKELKHIHIIRLFDFFEEPSTYYLVMERMRGGELFDRIVAKAYYNEKEARDTCKIVLEAIQYCHDNHVAHRDLKPENLLLLSETDDSAVKIADFGFAKKCYERCSLVTQCGTPGYVAPEILEGTPYDERADMWSVGVILYILLGGYPPFIESTQRDLFRKIRKGEYEFHEEYWGTVSADAKELISSLLTVDANKRITADEALENDWILGDDAELLRRDLGANLNKMRTFNAKRKFRAAVQTIIAINKLNSLKEAFFTNLKTTAIQKVAEEIIDGSSHHSDHLDPFAP